MSKGIRERKVPVQDGGVAVLEQGQLPVSRREGGDSALPRTGVRSGHRSGSTSGSTLKGRRRDDARRRYVATLAHEVRAPLAAIRNYSEVLLNCPPAAESERRSFLRAIAEESDRLNRLLEELNLLEKLESGHDPFSPSPTDLGEAATSAALGLHPLAASKLIDIQLAGLDQAPLVWGEPNLIARAVLVLLENAVKFSLPGGVVRIALTGDFETRTATLTVDDDGIGVPHGMENRIFEKFAQAAVPPDEVSPRGSGVGLALGRAIAERHGGRIQLQKKERGSTFRLTLPLCS